MTSASSCKNSGNAPVSALRNLEWISVHIRYQKRSTSNVQHSTSCLGFAFGFGRRIGVRRSSPRRVRPKADLDSQSSRALCLPRRSPAAAGRRRVSSCKNSGNALVRALSLGFASVLGGGNKPPFRILASPKRYNSQPLCSLREAYELIRDKTSIQLDKKTSWRRLVIKRP